MKKVCWLTAVLLIVCLSVPAWAETESSVIRVQGNAAISTVPDLAMLEFGVEIIDEDAAEAQKQASIVIADAIAAMKALGVEETNISSGSMMIQRNWEYTSEATIPKGFTASTRLNVALSDIPLAGKVVDAVLAEGVNSLNSIELSSSKHSEYYDQALSEAMKNARHKADVLAEAQGAAINGLVSVQEEYSSSMYKGENVACESAYADGSGAGNTVIASGQIKIEANISAEFSFESFK